MAAARGCIHGQGRRGNPSSSSATLAFTHHRQVISLFRATLHGTVNNSILLRLRAIAASIFSRLHLFRVREPYANRRDANS